MRFIQAQFSPKGFYPDHVTQRKENLKRNKPITVNER